MRIGDWVRLPDGTVGQVWSEYGFYPPNYGHTTLPFKSDQNTRMSPEKPPKWWNPKEPTVWVADGKKFHAVPVKELSRA